MITPKDYLSICESLNYVVFKEEKFKPYNLNIVGLRNKSGKVNHFDDCIMTMYQSNGEWKVDAFAATTLPGSPSLLNPVNKSGTAILVPGQYVSTYMLGEHKGKYEALVQAKPVKVYRDNTRDLIYDLSKIEEGFFGINIHRASLSNLLVGPDSAGCQVIKDRLDYNYFIELCRKASNFWGNSFTYTLLEI